MLQLAEEELSRSALLEKSLVNFIVNPFPLNSLERYVPVFSTANFIGAPADDLYFSDIISRNSPTIGEASLFLGDRGSFARER
jgi:hypothetical protein